MKSTKGEKTLYFPLSRIYSNEMGGACNTYERGERSSDHRVLMEKPK
jgi:hypothetical protein